MCIIYLSHAGNMQDCGRVHGHLPCMQEIRLTYQGWCKSWTLDRGPDRTGLWTSSLGSAIIIIINVQYACILTRMRENGEFVCQCLQ